MGVRLNVAEHGFSIAVYNRTLSKVDTCLSRAEAELGEAAGNMVGCFSAEEFIASLSRPRKVMFLVTAGPVVDIAINQFATSTRESGRVCSTPNTRPVPSTSSPSPWGCSKGCLD